VNWALVALPQRVARRSSSSRAVPESGRALVKAWTDCADKCAFRAPPMLLPRPRPSDPGRPGQRLSRAPTRRVTASR